MMEYTLFGESHGPAVGVLLQNVPAGLPVDDDLIQADLLRRRASGDLATGRHEADEVEFLSGVFQGKTTGDALVAVLRNRDVRSGDYAALKDTPAPATPTTPPLSAPVDTTTIGAAGGSPDG